MIKNTTVHFKIPFTILKWTCMPRKAVTVVYVQFIKRFKYRPSLNKPSPPPDLRKSSLIRSTPPPLYTHTYKQFVFNLFVFNLCDRNNLKE